MIPEEIKFQLYSLGGCKYYPRDLSASHHQQFFSPYSLAWADSYPSIQVSSTSHYINTLLVLVFSAIQFLNSYWSYFSSILWNNHSIVLLWLACLLHPNYWDYWEPLDFIWEKRLRQLQSLLLLYASWESFLCNVEQFSALMRLKSYTTQCPFTVSMSLEAVEMFSSTRTYEVVPLISIKIKCLVCSELWHAAIILNSLRFLRDIPLKWVFDWICTVHLGAFTQPLGTRDLLYKVKRLQK